MLMSQVATNIASNSTGPYTYTMTTLPQGQIQNIQPYIAIEHMTSHQTVVVPAAEWYAFQEYRDRQRGPKKYSTEEVKAALDTPVAKPLVTMKEAPSADIDICVCGALKTGYATRSGHSAWCDYKR